MYVPGLARLLEHLRLLAEQFVPELVHLFLHPTHLGVEPLPDVVKLGIDHGKVVETDGNPTTPGSLGLLATVAAAAARGHVCVNREKVLTLMTIIRFSQVYLFSRSIPTRDLCLNLWLDCGASFCKHLLFLFSLTLPLRVVSVSALASSSCCCCYSCPARLVLLLLLLGMSGMCVCSSELEEC